MTKPAPGATTGGTGTDGRPSSTDGTAGLPPSQRRPGMSPASIESPQPAGEPAPRAGEQGQAPPVTRRPRWPDLILQVLIAAAAAAVFSWGLYAPSLWRDETVTLGMARRSLADILSAVSHHDLVHAAYYAIMHGVITALQPLGVDMLTAARGTAVVAMAATAVVLFRLGRLLAGRGPGVLAAALFAGSPLASRYAQEARSYALVVLSATTAGYLLVLACRRTAHLPARTADGDGTPDPALERDAPGRRRAPRTWPWWTGYGVLLLVTTILNLMAVTVVLAHAVYVLLFARRSFSRWAAALVAALIPIAGFGYLSFLQRDQIAWIKPPTGKSLQGFFLSEFGTWWVFAAVAVIFVVALPLRARTDAGSGRRPPAGLVVLGLSWAVLPALALWAVSFQHPLWVPRYALFTLPGTALGLAGGVAALLPWLAPGGALPGSSGPLGRSGAWERPAGRRSARPEPGDGGGRSRAFPVAAALVTVAAVVLGLPAQAKARTVDGHGEDLRGALDYLDGHAHPGDAVVFLPSYLRQTQVALPERFLGLRDPLLGEEAVRFGDISGHDVPSAQFAARLRGSTRIWVLSGPAKDKPSGPDAVKQTLLTRNYRMASIHPLTWWNVSLYVARTRKAATPAS